jgi:hypothetical protein
MGLDVFPRLFAALGTHPTVSLPDGKSHDPARARQRIRMEVLGKKANIRADRMPLPAQAEISRAIGCAARGRAAYIVAASNAAAYF